MPKVYLCFDFGLKRIGVAVGNDLLKQGQELAPVKAQDGSPVWTDIEKHIRDWQPKELLVGLPLNMDGSESDMSLRANKFGKRLKGRFNLVVHMVDERLSSYAAKSEHIAQNGYTDFGKHSIDGAAACLILESWFYRNDTEQGTNTHV